MESIKVRGQEKSGSGWSGRTGRTCGTGRTGRTLSAFGGGGNMLAGDTRCGDFKRAVRAGPESGAFEVARGAVMRRDARENRWLSPVCVPSLRRERLLEMGGHPIRQGAIFLLITFEGEKLPGVGGKYFSGCRAWQIRRQMVGDLAPALWRRESQGGGRPYLVLQSFNC